MHNFVLKIKVKLLLHVNILLFIVMHILSVDKSKFYVISLLLCFVSPLVIIIILLTLEQSQMYFFFVIHKHLFVFGHAIRLCAVP